MENALYYSLIVFGVSALASIVSGLSYLGSRRFRGMSYREIMSFNPPAALMSLYARGLPYSTRVAAVSGVAVIVAFLLRLIF